MSNDLFELSTMIISQAPAKPTVGDPAEHSQGQDAAVGPNDSSDGNRKFLEVLLHQMPRKLQQSLADALLPPIRKTPVTIDSPVLPLMQMPPCDTALWQREEWCWQWSQSFAEQAQRSLDCCWQLFKDFSLSSFVRFDYFERCYRSSKDCLERELRGELQIILQQQPEYPASLLPLRQPPRLLFLRGELPQPNALSTAIVGSRRADSWALQQAWQEAVLLQKQYLELEEAKSGQLGFDCPPAKQAHWVISGLAYGCDYAAHKGTLQAKGRTLALLPGGFDQIYPKRHSGLAQQIVAEGGALVSEYVPQAEPLKWRFIQRDRLQAALAQQLLLVESSWDGGSMHAVHAALELGKPVYVLDGSETCWQIEALGALGPPETGMQLSGSVQLRPHPQQFSQDPALMAANWALLDRKLAKIWRMRRPTTSRNYSAY